jgi:hypothetical protein
MRLPRTSTYSVRLDLYMLKKAGSCLGRMEGFWKGTDSEQVWI